MNTIATIKLITLALALPLQAGAQEARADVKTTSDTVVIRYDPESIFLTHPLVAPLCAKAVVLTRKGSDERVGRFVLHPMAGNALQPKGVFIGRLSIQWVGKPPAADEAKRIFESGIQQLRKALSSRLERPRRRILTRRVHTLEQANSELTAEITHLAKRLRAAEDLVVARRQAVEATEQQRGSEVKHRAARQEVMVSMAGVRQAEAKIVAAKQQVMQIRLEIERLSRLVKDGVVSNADLLRAKEKLPRAESSIRESEAGLEQERVRVEQHAARVATLGANIERYKGARALAERRIASLEKAHGSAGAPSMEDTLDFKRARLAEVGSLLERARAELATVPGVTIERW